MATRSQWSSILVQLILSAIGIGLAVLCLTAGQRPNEHESYALLTVNTSRIGESLLSRIATLSSLCPRDPQIGEAGGALGPIVGGITSAAPALSSAVGSVVTGAPGAFATGVTEAGGVVSSAVAVGTSAAVSAATVAASGVVYADCRLSTQVQQLEGTIEGELEQTIGSFAKVFGISDFYSAHIRTTCQGSYEPFPVPNATYPASGITQNVSQCSTLSGLFGFDPSPLLQAQLEESGLDAVVNLTALQWPSQIDAALTDLSTAAKIAPRCYIVVLALLASSVAADLLFALSSLCGAPTAEVSLSRALILLQTCTLMVAAVIGVIIAAATTAVIRDGARVVNQYGSGVGITATEGSRFLAATWALVALLFGSLAVWLGLGLAMVAQTEAFRKHPVVVSLMALRRPRVREIVSTKA